jgi:hypothetical protein
MNSAEPTVRLIVTLLGTDACDVAFEPEGAVIALTKGDALTVEVRGPGDGVVEVSYHPDGISITAWSGAQTFAWDRAGSPLTI